MLKSASSLQESAVLPEHPSPKPEEIRRQLRGILASPSFHGSKRGQQFLEYVCEKSLAGEAGALKERTIAVEVFGRQPQSDLGEDTIVRVGAREVRKRLAQYYMTPEGMAYEVRIELPLGSYVPEFRYAVAATHQQEETPAAPVSVAEESLPRHWNRRAILAAGLAVPAASAAWLWVRRAPEDSNTAAFRQFWAPVLAAPEPLLIAVAHPLVYHASSRAIRLSEEHQPPQEVPLQRPLVVPPKQLDGSDLVPVFNQYVGFGDMVAANEVSAMLARQARPVRLRLASTIEFADLRNAQTLLIGAVTNRWTMQLQQQWRFRFSWTPGTRTTIVDTQETAGAKPSGPWTIQAKEDGSAQEDYILLSRVRNSLTGGSVMLAAGLKQFGTEAAGRLLADPEHLGPLLNQLPAGWDSKNLQFVLRAKVINNTAAQPEVVASHVW